ncbi:TonB-dependent receptor [Sphingomonas sp. BIUV-7]|uniref:TonB-dependent receptor n=1 Tax=Sphingomonas natans TaxID=3063330 RepID=A0ABT8Y792_9SPHN|nr:TonB-dependent receptor [Sphingomonas sp. BIUV-7]MDO6414189.1 TonB-dependent receptor [Sphingomonas sp. BIUV-7]
MGRHASRAVAPLGLLCILQASPGVAQQHVDGVGNAGEIQGIRDSQASAGGGLEEIVVTANKRSENVQNVPASVLAVTAAGLERANVRDFDDVVRVAPSLTISKTSQPANNSINIRGIGTYAFSISTQPSVAVVADDIPQAFQAAAFTALTDVAQIEVLRGPQSTLFGKAASAGVVNITTAAPTKDFTLGGQGLITSDHERRIQASVSGPITETLSGRLTGNYSKYRGTLYNDTTGNWLNGQSDLTLRGKLVWTPSADWTVTLIPYVVRTRASCCAPALYFLSPGVTFARANVPQSTLLGSIVPSPDNRRTRLDTDAKGNSTDYGSGLKIAHDLSGGQTVMLISSYDRYHLIDRQDTDSSDYNFQLSDPRLPFGGSTNGGFFTIRTVTEEVRLTSPSSGRFRYVGGLFYSNTASIRDFTRGSLSLGNFNGIANLPSTNTIAYSYYDSRSKQSTYALFGQLSYDLTDKLTVISGGRLHREELSYNFTDFGNNITYGNPKCDTKSGTATVPISTCDHDNVVTGSAAIQYRFSPGIMVFGHYARGYKGLAYDLTSTFTVRTPLTTGQFAGVPTADGIAARQPIAPEHSNAFEGGFKATLLGGRLTWNMTGFYEEYLGFQAQSRDEVTNQNILNSLGKVTSKGVEMELAARFVPGLTLNLNGAYNIAKINDFPGAACFSRQTAAQGCVGGVQDLSGARLPNAPKWTAALSGEYERRLTDGLTGFINASMRYQTGVNFSLLGDPDAEQKGYALANFGVGVSTDHFKVTVFVNNAFDQNYVLTKGREVVWNTNPTLAVNPTNAISFKPGRDSERYYGVRLGFNF